MLKCELRWMIEVRYASYIYDVILDKLRIEIERTTFVLWSLRNICGFSKYKLQPIWKLYTLLPHPRQCEGKPIHAWVTLLTRETFSKLDQGYDYNTTLVQRENPLKSIISLLKNLQKIELPWLRNVLCQVRMNLNQRLLR